MRCSYTATHYPAASKYSAELRELVRKCLEFDVGDRPKLKDIYTQANNKLEEQDIKDSLMDQEKLGFKLPVTEDFRIGN